MAARRWTAVVLALIGMAVAVWLVAGDADAPRGAVVRTEPAQAPAAVEHPPTPVPAAEVDAAPPAGERAAVEPVAAEPGHVHPESRVHGRVIDVGGRPLGGVGVSMDSVGARWLSRDLYPYTLPEVYDTETGVDGRFALVMPLPTSDWISLMIAPGDFHGRAGRVFGLAGGRNEEPLRPGDNGLGDFVLPDAGAIEGRVVDAAGLSVAGATARLNGAFPGGYSAWGESGTDGRYRIAHVPGGVYGVEVLADEYVTGRLAGVTVHDGEVTETGTCTLAPAPVIAGRVVDESGMPLAGVHVWGSPAGGGTGARARSTTDGTFRMHLPQDEPHALEATLPGYAKHDPGRGVQHAPGTEDIQIVLLREQVVTFAVRGPGGEPVERFGLKIIETRTPGGGTISSSAHREPARVGAHAGGEMQLAADPELHEYTILAPGYAPRRGHITYDVEGAPRQTITLEGAAALRGRFLHESRPIASPSVRVAADRFPLDPTLDDEDDFFSSNWTTDLDAFQGRLRLEAGAVDGTFRIGDLAPGTYELTLDGPGVAPLVVERLRLEAGEERDLGDLSASAPGALHGVVALTPGISPAGLRVMLGSGYFGDDETARTVDVTGTFRFEGLGAGKHFVHVEEKSGVVVEGEPFAFELAPGEEREVRLDLTPRVPCRIEARVLLGGAPLAGLLVEARVQSEGGGERRWQLGRTDDTGLCAGDVPPDSALGLRATSEHGLLVAELVGTTDAPPGGTLYVEIEGPAPGRLELTLPADVQLHPASPAVLLVRSFDRDATPSRSLIVHAWTRDWVEEAGARRLDLGPAIPGSYRVQLQTPEGVSYWAEATVTGGATAVLDLAP